jgi:cell fate regulator YaaT (PSP1 superfamily)
MNQTLLVRYGTVPEVARFSHDLAEPPARHERVVVYTHRGLELGTALETIRQGTSGGTAQDPAGGDADDSAQRVLRRASAEDEARHAELSLEAQATFSEWQKRIDEWNLNLDLIDLEWTLDRQKLVLYVLGGRGPEATKLALQAAAAGLAVVEVQPVTADGPVPLPSAGSGCGSGGCGCEH